MTFQLQAGSQGAGSVSVRRRMRATFFSVLAALLLALSATTARAAERQPLCFTNELAAFTNGLKVLAAVRAGDTQSKARVAPLIGSRVLFQGDNWNRPYGTNADLNLGSGVLLRVELTP